MSTFKPYQLIQHVKTGGVYTVLMTPENKLRLEHSGKPAYMYASEETGEVWVRDAVETEDGRFIRFNRSKVNLKLLDSYVYKSYDFKNPQLISKHLITWVKEPPYHNLEHCRTVGEIAAILIGQELRNDDRDPGYIQEMTDAALIAGYFHDQGHSGGAKPDWDNIAKAIHEFESAFLKDPSIGLHGAEIIEAIRCTEFPFIHEPQTLLGKCLRDADILYAVVGSHEDIIRRNLALYQEMNKKTPMDLRDFGIRNEKFRETVVLFTETGKQLNELAFLKNNHYYSGEFFARMGKNINQFDFKGQTYFTVAPQPT